MSSFALYALVLAASIGESLAFVGLLIPGVGVVFGAGLIAARGGGELPLVGALASLGSAVGFALSYWAGKASGGHIGRWGQRAHGALERARAFFERFGGWSIFWGHFFGPVRAFVSFAAGAGGLSARRFWPASLLGSLAWGYGLTLSGALASGGWSFLEGQLGRGSVVVGSLLALLYVLLRIAVGALGLGLRLLPPVAGAAAELLAVAAARSGSDPARQGHPRFRTRLSRLSADRAAGLLLGAGALACLLFAWFFFGVVEDLLFREPLLRADQNVFHLVESIRSAAGVPLFRAVARLASGAVLSITAVAAAGALVLLGRTFEAGLLAGGFGAGEGLLWVLHRWLAEPHSNQTQVLAKAARTFASNDAFSSIALFGFIGYLAGRCLPTPAARARLHAWTGILIVAIGTSELYLGAQWLSGVLAGYALGGIWLAALVAAAEARARFGPERPPVSLRVAGAAALAVAGPVLAAWFWTASRSLPAELGRAPVAPATVAGEALDQELGSIDDGFVESLFGKSLGHPSLALVSRDGDLLGGARAAGWVLTDPATVGSLFAHAIRAFQGTLDPEAPLSPLFWNGIPHELGFAKTVPSGGRWTARLWRTGTQVEMRVPIWAAYVRYERRPDRFLGVPLPSAQHLGAATPQPFAGALVTSGRFREAPGGPQDAPLTLYSASSR